MRLSVVNKATKKKPQLQEPGLFVHHLRSAITVSARWRQLRTGQIGRHTLLTHHTVGQRADTFDGGADGLAINQIT